jgi:putative membrane protein
VTEHERPPAGSEPPHPDYRFSLANERTFLAWCRTALALLAAGVGVVYLPASDVLPNGRKVLGLLLVVLGGFSAASSYARWRANRNAIASGAPLPRSNSMPIVAAGLVVVAIVALVVVVANF